MEDVLALISTTMAALLKDVTVYTTNMEDISQLYDMRALYRASHGCATDMILSEAIYDKDAYHPSLNEHRVAEGEWAMVSIKLSLIKELARAHIFSTHPYEMAYLIQRLKNKQKKKSSFLILEMPIDLYRSLADRVPSQFLGLKVQQDDGHVTRLLKSNILEKKQNSMLLDPNTPKVSIDKVVEGIKDLL